MEEGGGNAPGGTGRPLGKRFEEGDAKRSPGRGAAGAGAVAFRDRVSDWARSPATRRLGWLAALVAVFAVAMIWRFHYASRTEIYTYDSYFYMVLGRNLRHGFNYQFIAGHAHFKFMPLYPMSLAFFSLIGLDMEFAGKFSNILFTSACVFPIYVIGSLLFHRRVGLAAAALFAFEPITTTWAMVPMSEGLFALLVCLAVCCLVCWIKKEKSYWIYLAAAASGLATITRWEGFFLLALLGIYGAYYCWRGRMSLRQLLLAGAIALAPFGVLVLRNLIVFGTPIKSAYLSEFSAHDPNVEVLGPLQRLGRYLTFGGIDPVGGTKHLAHYGYVLFGYAGLALGLFIRRFRAGVVLLIAWIVFMGPTHFIWYFVAARFLFAAVPALCLGAGFILGFPWVSDSRNRDHRAAMVFVYTLAICIIAVLAFTSVPIINDSFHRDIKRLQDDDGGLATKEAMLWLSENGGGAGVAARSGPMTTFYLGRDVLFLGDWVFEPGDIRLEHIIEDAHEKGVRYLVLHGYSPYPEEALVQAGIDPAILSELRLVKVFSAPSDGEWTFDAYSFVFEIP
jgi:hypothetical protein